MRPLVKQIQLPLHRQVRVRQLSFRLFLCLSALRHLLSPSENEQGGDYFSGLQIQRQVKRQYLPEKFLTS